MIDIVVALGAIGIWFLLYAATRVATRPVTPGRGPATMELGPEPPALVSLLANRYVLTEDAAESTLLDLAARRFFELRQPAGDPMQTTVHLPANPPDGSGLRAYEKQVLVRVRDLAVGGVVPVTALTFRNSGDSARWNGRLRSSVIADARAAGLSRPRFGKGHQAVLVVAALVAGLVAWFAAWHHSPHGNDNIGAGIGAAVILSAIALRTSGERDTPAGREVAARWLGVQTWLRGHDQFAELPPAAVAVWDRYLSYGAALGVTRLASAVLDLEMGNRKLLWSSYGDTWHRVRARYPHFWVRFGRPLPHNLLRAAITIVFGAAWLHVATLHDYVGRTALVILLAGVYILVRTLIDAAVTRTVTGEVLWRDTWKSKGGGEDNPPVPWLDYLVIDDGHSDRTTAWGLPTDTRATCRPGDIVTITVRPWTRRVVTVVEVGSGRSRQIAETVTEEQTGDLALAMLPGIRAAAVFSDDDVSRVIGRPVRQQPIPLGTEYKDAATGKVLLLVQSVGGLPGRVAWRANGRGTELPGGGFVNGERAAFRRGETTVVLTLMGDGRAARANLPDLVARAAV